MLIKSSGDKVNIRTGNGTIYSRITAIAPGTILEYMASAFNGWHAVKIGSQVGWVSGEYSEITAAGLQSGSYEPDCRPVFCVL